MRALYERFERIGLAPTDLEVVLLEAPRASWGIRGHTGDEPELDYRTALPKLPPTQPNPAAGPIRRAPLPTHLRPVQQDWILAAPPR